MKIENIRKTIPTYLEDKKEISNELTIVIIKAVEILFSKVNYEEIGPLVMDKFIWCIDFIAQNSPAINDEDDKQIQLVERLFKILVGCICKDDRYLLEYAAYKENDEFEEDDCEEDYIMEPDEREKSNNSWADDYWDEEIPF